ncbi:MAG: YdeI/OmpD-associated family protein, partial [Limisphaerales bacterium]
MRIKSMVKKKIATGTVHKVPDDLRTSLLSDAAVLALWNGLTPLARNEWICWVTSVRKPETRSRHMDRVCS